MATTVLSGSAFGAALLVAGFHQPAAVISQLRLENFHMIQAFMTAAASSAFVYPVLERLNVVPHLQPRSSSPLLGLFTNYDGNILGGAMLGAGMALASACPGTLLVQTAVGVRTGVFALAGSVVGGVIWSGFLRGAIKSQAERNGVKSHTSTLEDVTRVPRSVMVALFEVMCASAVGAAATYTEQAPWAVFPGFISGLFIGGAQLFSLVTRKSMMGISGSYEEVGNYTAWILSGMPSKSRPAAYKNIVFAIGCVLGAWTLKFTAPQFVLPPVGELRGDLAFLGGISMTIGSRMAGGCTSGHGISGLSLMSVSSAITIASTFAGGMVVAQLI